MACASETAINVNDNTAEVETSADVNEHCQVKIKLADMKVADLKIELEKRNLDKSGVKSVLMEKLKNALLEEGEDPEKFNFAVSTDSAKTKSSKKKQIPDFEMNGTLNTDEENADEKITDERNTKEKTSEVKDTDGKNTEVKNTDEKNTEVKTFEEKNTEEKNTEEKDTDEKNTEEKNTDERDTDEKNTEEKNTDGKDTDEKNTDEKSTKEKDFDENTQGKNFDEKNAQEKDTDEKNTKEKDTDEKNTKEKDTDEKNTKEKDADEKNIKEKYTDEASCEKEDAADLEAHNYEEKINHDITLQLSIDEEEAQLNEDENILETPESMGEVDLKQDELNPSDSKTVNIKCPIPEASSVPVSLAKSPKRNSENIQEQKVIKTPQSVKSVESSASSKALILIAKNDKIKNANLLAKTLWVTALPTTIRAADLKTLFSKQGRVLSVKIVKSTKQTPCKCYGFVTMANNSDATRAIENLHGIELNGRIISVEQTQSEPSALLKKSESKILTRNSKKPPPKKESAKTNDSSKQSSIETKSTTKTDTKSSETKLSNETSKGKEEKSKSRKAKEKETKSRNLKEKDSRRSVIRKSTSSRSRPSTINERPRLNTFRRAGPFVGRSGLNSTSFRSRSDLSAYERMKEDRFNQREHFRERERREAERRQAIEASRHKFIERKQREEAFRLDREKEKLRIEREILERERAELLKLERERQILERERLEREKEELRRQAELTLSRKRSFARDAEPFWDDRKKPRFEDRFEFPSRERSSISRPALERHPEAFRTSKAFTPVSRSELVDSQARREVTVRSREERRVFERSDARDRDVQRSFSSREREGLSATRRESPRMDWKRERRAQERIVTPRSSSGQRRMTYY